MIKCICMAILLNIALFSNYANADEAVPPKAAGLWEFKSENFQVFTPPDNSPQLAILSPRLREAVKKEMEESRKPLGPQISRRCIAVGDPKPKSSPEVDNMLAKSFTCYSTTTTREGEAYVVRESCSTAAKSMILRSVYRGDFNRRVTQEYYTTQDGIEKLNARLTMRRLGECPQGK